MGLPARRSPFSAAGPLAAPGAGGAEAGAPALEESRRRDGRAAATASRDSAILVALTLLALALRLACAGQSLFGDELILFNDVHDHSLGLTLGLVHDTELTPPLGFVLAWAAAKAGHPEVLVRLPSLLAGTATVPLLFLLGRRTVGRAAGIVAAAWFALSPFAIFYGTEARAYALVTALLVASTLALLRALDGGGRGRWLVYAVMATAALYTHYIAILTLVPQAAWALVAHRERLREQLLAHGLVLMAFVPWLPSLVVQSGHSGTEAAFIHLAAPVGGRTVAQAVARSLAGHPAVGTSALPGRLALVGLGLLVAAGLVLTVRVARRPATKSPAVLLGLLALAPLAALVLYSLRPHTSFLLPRNVSGAMPYALVLLGAVLTTGPPRWAFVMSCGALAMVAVGTVMTLGPDYARPDARGVARYLDAHAAPGVPVIDGQIARYDKALARGTRIYLRRPHRLFGTEATARAWREARRARSALLVAGPSQGDAAARPGPAGYRLAARRTFRGLVPLAVVTYVPVR